MHVKAYYLWRLGGLLALLFNMQDFDIYTEDTAGTVSNTYRLMMADLSVVAEYVEVTFQGPLIQSLPNCVCTKILQSLLNR